MGRGSARFQEISIPGYQRIGAPRVGYDSAANDWIVAARKPKTPEEAAAVLKEFHGYYVVSLLKCDGVPEYSSGGLYESADETSFRASFFSDCQDVLGNDLLNDAWSTNFRKKRSSRAKQNLSYVKRLSPAARLLIKLCEDVPVIRNFLVPITEMRKTRTFRYLLLLGPIPAVDEARRHYPAPTKSPWRFGTFVSLRPTSQLHVSRSPGCFLNLDSSIESAAHKRNTIRSPKQE